MQTRPVAKSVPDGPAAIEVRSPGPFSAGATLWRDASNRVLATVVAKATYSLAQETSEIVDAPDPIRDGDTFWEAGAAGSLRFPSDLAPFKAAHEVIVVGHVHAAENRPVHAATARIVVGEVDKIIAATSPRRMSRDGQLHHGAPQTSFSLRYELAAGGIDNPVGVDPMNLTPAGDHMLPQLAPPSHEPRPGHSVPLIGLGPVSPSWRQRDSLLRAEDRAWLQDPLHRPRPQAFDARYFCVAPADQRTTEAFRADARLILEGLHPAHVRLVTNLAGVTPTLRSVGPRRPLPSFVADTLLIDTDRQIATLTFRAVVPLGGDNLVLEIVAEGYNPGGEATTELDRSSLSDAARALAGETKELDRSAFSAAVSSGLVFTPTSKPSRPPLPSVDDGALPFRPSPSSPQSSPQQPPSSPQSSPQLASAPQPSPPPPSPQRPPLVSAPPKEAFIDPPPPPPIVPPAPAPVPAPAAAPPPSPFGQLQSLVRSSPAAEARRAQDQAFRAPEASGQGEPKDRFRKAFGGGDAAGAKLATSAPPVSVGAKPAEGIAPAGGLKSAFDAVTSPGGVKAASDAAVAAEAREGGWQEASASPIDRAAVLARRAIVDLLAFEPAVPGRLRRSKVHAPLLVAATPPRAHQKVDVPVSEQTPEDRARFEVLRVLSCGAPLGPDDLHTAADALLDDPHDFDIPLLLVEGEVRPTMDEVETLRVAADLAKPLAGNNKRVQGAVAIANDALSRAAPPLSDAATALYRQLVSSTSELSLPPRHFADLVDRTLLEARSFKKRTLLGAPRIRAELTFGRLTLPIYLPDAVASSLPLLPVFSLAALVELRPREDVSEPNPAALVAFALGRVLRARKSDRG